MSGIQKLSKVSTLAGTDLLPLLSQSFGADASVTLTTFVSWLQAQLLSAGVMATQYASPNATGFSVSVTPPTSGQSVFLLITPVAGYAAGTVVLPAVATAADGQEVLLHTTQSVGTLTTSGNGASVNGAPSALSQFGFFRLRFDGVNGSWYRVG
jgi:hypothetical protein